MTDAGIEHLLEGWRQWTAKVLDCGVAGLGGQTASEIGAWARLAETAGWHEDARLARWILEEGRTIQDRSRRFMTSVCRLQIASGLWRRERLQRTNDRGVGPGATRGE